MVQENLDTQKMVADSVKSFGEKHIEPYREKWDDDEHFPIEVFHKLGELGLMGILVPEKYGGTGLGYHEYVTAISELAYFGARVIHPKTLIPVKDDNIPVYVRNTFNLENKGTLIQNNDRKSKHIIDAITSINNHKLITIQGMAMMGVSGVAAKTFLTINKMNISVPFITQASSEQTICFAVRFLQPSPGTPRIFLDCHGSFCFCGVVELH